MQLFRLLTAPYAARLQGRLIGWIGVPALPSNATAARTLAIYRQVEGSAINMDCCMAPATQRPPSAWCTSGQARHSPRQHHHQRRALGPFTTPS